MNALDINSIQNARIDIRLPQIPERPFLSKSKIIMIAAGDHQDSPEMVIPGVSAMAAMNDKRGIRNPMGQRRVILALSHKNIIVKIK